MNIFNVGLSMNRQNPYEVADDYGLLLSQAWTHPKGLQLLLGIVIVADGKPGERTWLALKTFPGEDNTASI